MFLKLLTDTISTNGESLGGNGIKNMHARADDVNAKLSIHSKINEGTTDSTYITSLNFLPNTTKFGS